MIRLYNQRLPSYTFSLDGLKTALGVMELQFSEYTSEDTVPPITLEFSSSQITHEYKENNWLLTEQFRLGGAQDISSILSTLLNNSPPTSDDLLQEGSGCGQIKVFLAQIRAEFLTVNSKIGDNNALCGLDNNLLRVASDFFWAHYLCSFLSVDGSLSDAKKTELEESLRAHLELKYITLPEDIIAPLFLFMRHTFLGAAHLNKSAAQIPIEVPLQEPHPAASRKRKRIIERLALGLTPLKKRKFPFSRVKEALNDIEAATIDVQVRILEVQSIVVRPSNRTVELARSFSARAHTYMKESCAMSNNDIIALEANANLLTD